MALHERSSRTAAARGVSTQVAGVVGGLVAGVAYLTAQVSFTGLLRSGAAAEPLQRIAAILLGPDAAPPPAELNFTVFGMALIIHFGLSMVFGRVVGTLVRRMSLVPAVATGALTGGLLYALDFLLIAPAAFPWFEDSVQALSLADHLLFGAVAAAVCVAVREPRPA